MNPSLCAVFCSVFTPYYSETVLYSLNELRKKNEDGISTLFYLQKIYPGMFSIELHKEILSSESLLCVSPFLCFPFSQAGG